MALCLLIQGAGFGPDGSNPESVRCHGYGLHLPGANSVPVFLNLHHTADQIVPLCVVFHEMPFVLEFFDVCMRTKSAC